MKEEVIDLLVVGLPVAQFGARKAALEKLMAGRHDVGNGKTVIVLAGLYKTDRDITFDRSYTNVTVKGWDQQNVRIVSTNNQFRIFTCDPGARCPGPRSCGNTIAGFRGHSVPGAFAGFRLWFSVGAIPRSAGRTAPGRGERSG